MSAGFVDQGFGASSLRNLTKSNAQIDLYVDPIAGNDFNLGTIGSPFRTLGFVDSILPNNIDHPVNIHLKNAVYQLPATGTFLESRVLNSTIRIYGDSVWDPSVNQVLHAEPAQAGTTAAVIKQTGLIPDTLYGKTCEVTIGGAVQRKTIKGNTATDVLVCEKFNPPPNPGDAVRITQSTAILRTPIAASTIGEYTFCRHQAVSAQDPFAGAFGPAVQPQAGVILENVAIENNASYTAIGFSEGVYFFYGVDLRRVGPTNATVQFNYAQAFSGFGLNDHDADRGFCLSSGNFGSTAPPTITNGGSFSGYFAGQSGLPSANFGGTVTLFSGFAINTLVLEGRSVVVFGNVDSTIPFTIAGLANVSPAPDNALAGLAAIYLSFAVEFTNLSVNPAITVKNGGLCSIDSTVTGGSAGPVAVLVETGGRVYVKPNPVFGGAGGLWKTTNTAGVTRAALIPGFALVDPVDASAIIVTS